MSRLAACFDACRQTGRTALIPYLTAGDGGAQATLDALHSLAESGADIIELGMPFSDPMADGPVIQKACERALEAGMSLSGVLDIVREFRADNHATPIVLMGYMNPIERYGHERFAADAAAAGVDGVLLVDCPPEEAAGIRQTLQDRQIDQIFLIAPTSTEQRLASICALASGFVYYVSLKGVTGAATLDQAALREPLNALRRHTGLPVAVGFGIKSPSDAVTAGAHADAVVIGSALVECLHHADDAAGAARGFLAPIRRALDEASRVHHDERAGTG